MYISRNVVDFIPTIQLSKFLESPRNYNSMLRRLADRLGIAAPSYTTNTSDGVDAALADLVMTVQDQSGVQLGRKTPQGHGASESEAAKALWRELMPVAEKGVAIVHFHTPKRIFRISF